MLNIIVITRNRVPTFEREKLMQIKSFIEKSKVISQKPKRPECESDTENCCWLTHLHSQTGTRI
jgi:hypothetical protein